MKIVSQPDKPKRKNFSKNKKKTWRRHIDIKYIDDYLEEKRREERTGGCLGELASEELFSFDYGNEAKTKQSHFLFDKENNQSSSTQSKEGLKPSFKNNKDTTLRCHQFLNGLSAIKPISKKRPTTVQGVNKHESNLKRLSKNKLRTSILWDRRKAQRKKDLRTKKNRAVCVEAKEDIWNKRETVYDMFDDVAKEFVKDKIEYYKEETKQRGVKVPSSIRQKPSLLPSVVIPKSGASYNPSLDEHQKLLQKALNNEKKKVAAEQKEKEIRRELKMNAENAPTNIEILAEMSEGLPLPKENSFQEELHEEEEEDEDNEGGFVKQIKHKKKKESKKKRALALKIQERKRLQRKAIKREEANVYMIKSYNKEIDKKEEKFKALMQKRKRRERESMYKTKRLSRLRFKEGDVDVQLGYELSDNVRTIKPLGNPVEDLMTNFMRRNILKPTLQATDTNMRKPGKKRPKPKRKKKTYLKNAEEMNKFLEYIKE